MAGRRTVRLQAIAGLGNDGWLVGCESHCQFVNFAPLALSFLLDRDLLTDPLLFFTGELVEVDAHGAIDLRVLQRTCRHENASRF